MYDYSREERQEMDKRARDGARKEQADDPNRKDPKHVQQRMDDAVHKLRVQWGLEKD